MSWVAVALLMLTVQAAPGVGGGVEVRATVVPDSLRIGERITLIVEVSGVTRGAEVVFPQLPDSGAVVALGPPLQRPVEADGTRSARYELVVWNLGVVPLPEAEVRVVTEAAELLIAVPALSVHVASVLPEAADPDTLAWRPAADVVGGNWGIQEKLAAAGLALALLLAAVLYARRRASVQPPPPPPVQPPRARALAALERLAAAGLPEAGELKALYSGLSYIVREFLAETDPTWRLDLTTGELVQAVSRDGLGERRQRALAGLLAGADLVKFACRRPSRAQAARALDATRRWIVEFERVVVEPPPESEPEPAPAPEPVDDLLSAMDDVFAAEAEEPEEPESLEP
jgi:hypothetical protein